MPSKGPPPNSTIWGGAGFEGNTVRPQRRVPSSIARSTGRPPVCRCLPRTMRRPRLRDSVGGGQTQALSSQGPRRVREGRGGAGRGCESRARRRPLQAGDRPRGHRGAIVGPLVSATPGQESMLGKHGHGSNLGGQGKSKPGLWHQLHFQDDGDPVALKVSSQLRGAEAHGRGRIAGPTSPSQPATDHAHGRQGFEAGVGAGLAGPGGLTSGGRCSPGCGARASPHPLVTQCPLPLVPITRMSPPALPITKIVTGIKT